MDRKILFRGKSSTKGWLFGDLLQMDGKTSICVEETDGYWSRYIVDEKTVCQYTGLTDKNGRKIFEGDVVSCSHSKIKNGEDGRNFMPEYEEYNRNYAVEFVNKGGRCGYRCRNKNIHFTITQNTIYNHDVEVIGNLWDNPELLNQ